MPDAAFTPRARLMVLLGDQLIRDAGIAVFELVKNAYDADATRCKILLDSVAENSKSARVIVEDNGTGMSPTTVKNVWLSPGTRHRLTQREEKLKAAETAKRSKQGRLPLGEKGLGRFAVHKLGNHVRIITRATNKKEVVVTIDWTTFDNDSPLSSIPVRVRVQTPKYFTSGKTGTRIEISGLRDLTWTRRRVRDLHRAVTSICSPIAGPDRFKTVLKLRPDPQGWLDGLLTAEEAMELALFRFHGTIENGKLHYDYSFKPLSGMKGVNARIAKVEELAVDLNPDSRKRTKKTDPDGQDDDLGDLSDYRIGPIKIDLHVFDRDRDVLQFVPGNMTLVTDFLNHNGGVRVYRDGVRVYDFGESGNDWLDLGGRRVNVPARRIGNNQVIGGVGLELAASKDLVEKTNREGFVENNAYRAFRAAVRFAITQAEAERNIDKQRIRTATAKPKQKQPVLDEVGEMRTEITNLKLEKSESDRLSDYLDRIETQYREILDRLLAAAGAGMNLSVVLHEVEKGIKTLLVSLQRGEDLSAVLKRAKELADIVDGLTWLTRQSGTSDVESDALIEHCLFAWSYRFINHHIKLTDGTKSGDPKFTIRGTRRLLMTALMNLIDNAIYWTGTKSEANRRIYVGTTHELTGNPAFVVADNGPGIKDSPEYLTMPFFTRRPDGMGLGLHIADEIMKMHGGRVEFIDRNDITLPKEFTGAVILLQFGDKTK
jgi:signal transduction histidine kinase